MKILTSREIVFKHVNNYFPDDKKWDTDKWVLVSDLNKEMLHIENLLSAKCIAGSPTNTYKVLKKIYSMVNQECTKR